MMAILHTKLLVKLGLASVLPLAIAGLPFGGTMITDDLKQDIATVTIAPSDFSYRIAGDFNRDNLPVTAPLVQRRLNTPLVIMKNQVGGAEYQRCVNDGVCRPFGQRSTARADLPAVGVSWEDASAYARWLSGKTGQTWRLPTDEEWTFAAASRAKDSAIATDDTGDFSQRWLAKYEQESASGRAPDRMPKATGTFGVNENGLLDIAGNVWEWTDTCFVRQKLDVRGNAIGQPTVNCGVRVVQGQHRAYVTDFIRDARAGGCSVGRPPDNLGFRLVREGKPPLINFFASLLQKFRTT